MWRVFMPPPGLFSYRPFWAKRFGIAPILPRSRREMEELGWDSCDIVIVTGDAYVDHPSFGMALIGRLLEDQGFRVGILDQPDWHSAEAFRVLGEPTLFFGVTGGNMDSLVNHYTSDKKPRSDDAYTPGGVSGARPDRASIVYTQRCREAYPDAPVVLGGIEASLRRLAHYDYWSDKVRRSLLVDSGADLLVFGNAERAIVEIAHRLARGEKARDILDVRGTAVRRITNDSGPMDCEPGTFAVERSDNIDKPSKTAAHSNHHVTKGGVDWQSSARSLDRGASGACGSIESPEGEGSPGDGSTGTAVVCETSLGLSNPYGAIPTVSAGPEIAQLVQLKRQRNVHSREKTVIRLPSWDAVKRDKLLYAHGSRVFHAESNPSNARCLVQRNGDTDVWVNPPPVPLTTEEMDHVYDLPYARVPHPDHVGKKLPAYEMIRFSVTIMRGCFGGCSFCSITEHEGRVIQNRSEASILRELAALNTLPGFTGAVSDLGGPTANMYRLGCKSRDIEAQCRRPSCVYPKICDNLNTDHGSLIQLYRKARAVPGIKKITIGSGLRYDLAVESPEYIKELVTHHVGGYLKIAPEHIAPGPLSKMMKPGIGTYDRFKELFDRYSKQAGKEQYLIPYFIAAHPGTTTKDMVELALWLKAHGYRADQVQAFLPSPMSYATAMYYSGKNPLQRIRRGEGDVHVPKTAEERALQKAFLRYHDAKNWPMLRQALAKMGQGELIGSGASRLVPRDNGYSRDTANQAMPVRRFVTQHQGLPVFLRDGQTQSPERKRRGGR